MTTKARATIEDLYKVPETAKAEIIDGELVLMPATGFMPARAGLKIAMSLVGVEDKIPGRACPNNVGYKVSLPNRDSFSPDASFYLGQPGGMQFLEGAPVFAAEVRSETDYRPSAEAAMARKRSDYFAAGTLIVWDVDLQGSGVIKSYDAAAPDSPKVFRRGDMANAEPVLPGWRLRVDDFFS
ncbi:MAG TPA: Uma2 family endonuclease [Blastocatellia bacterium]|nr:Uma2 family endonuclease [Blastocatellia bacterium]